MFALPYIYVSLLAISANFWLGTVAAQQWLPNGPTEYSARCALGTELSGEYICFTYYNDIRSAASGGVYQGYANASGTGFALVPNGNGVDESSQLDTADRRIAITWGGDSSAHVTIQKADGGGWSVHTDMDVQNPDHSYIFVL